MRQTLAAVVLNLLLVACSSIGPATVPHDRIDYGSSIGNSWKEQTLLNIVKLRYADMPIFLTPDHYVPCPLEASYQVTWGVFPAALKGPLELPSK